MKLHNIFSNIPEELPLEVSKNIIERDEFILERIISKGHVTPAGQWFDQEFNEWVMVMRGSAKVAFKDPEEEFTLEAGHYLNIPAHTLHRVTWTQPDCETIWLALHY